MSRTVVAGPDAVEIRLTGLTALAALARSVVIPYARIAAVGTEPFERRGTPRLWRTGGYGLGGTLHGHFRRGGQRLFLSFEDARRVVQLTLRPAGPGEAPFDVIAVGVPDPVATARAIRERCGRTG